MSCETNVVFVVLRLLQNNNKLFYNLLKYFKCIVLYRIYSCKHSSKACATDRTLIVTNQMCTKKRNLYYTTVHTFLITDNPFSLIIAKLNIITSGGIAALKTVRV